MPSVSSQVVGGDILDFMVDSPLGAVFTTASSNLGVQLVTGFSLSVGYIGRFELEIPEGSTIDSVKINFTSSGAGSFPPSTKNFALGFLADDGLWSAGGINATSYPARNLVPFPYLYNLVDYDAYPARWVGGSDPATWTSQTIFLGIGQEVSFADGASSVYPASGLVANLQEFVDNEPTGIRANSASGTALPVAFCVLPRLNVDGRQGIYASEIGAEVNRPFLTVEYTEPAPAGVIAALIAFARRIVAKVKTLLGISCRASSAHAVSARGNTA